MDLLVVLALLIGLLSIGVGYALGRQDR